MQPVALRLICNDNRATSESTFLKQNVYKSLISSLSQTATLHCRGLPCLADGSQPAVYEGRGANRDVYRVSEGFVLKLCTSEREARHQCNHREAAALQASHQLPQTPLLLFNGVCAVDGIDSVTLVVPALLVSYGGSSFAKLMHKYFALPYDRTVAAFFVTAYRNLAMMVIDGVQQNIEYAGLYTEKICTLSVPTQHVPWETIQIVIVNAEGVRPARLDRDGFNRCLDEMISDFELHCGCFHHPSWNFLAQEVSDIFQWGLFRQHGDLDLVAVRAICAESFRSLWFNVCKEAARSELLDVADRITFDL